MKRFVIAAASALTVLAAAAAGVDASQPRAQLRRFDCQRAVDPAARTVSVRAVMRPLSGTLKMAMRFELLSKTKAGHPYSPVRGGDLGSWISPSNPTLGQRPGDTWTVNKPVVDLAAPAAYRFRVFFRWTGAHDHVLGTAVKESPTCVQRELRPDLLVVPPIQVQSVTGQPSENRYVATIRNGGATAAGPFEVLFAPEGKTRNVAGLGSYSSTRVSFIGPVCTSTSPPIVEVDPNGQVEDYNRANNSLTVACPGSLAHQ
jgi:CARDB